MIKKLFRGSAILLVGTLVGSAFSYLFNMTMGRMLGPTIYGEMSALLSLLAILAVGSVAILTISMRYSSELFAHKEFLAIRKLAQVFSKYVLIGCAAIFLVGLILIKPIGSFLSIQGFWPVAITLFSIFFSYLLYLNRGILQGTQLFGSMSFSQALEMFLRLSIGILLVWFGFSLNGAMAAIVLSLAIAYIATFLPLRKIFQSKEQKSRPGVDQKFKFDKKEIIKYSIPTLVTSALIALTLNLDIILVKHYFPPYEAGLYAAISTVAKIILYITSPVVGVMFPLISEQQTRGKKHFRLFWFSLLLTLIGGILLLAIYTVAPEKIITILYGGQYAPYYYLLPEIGLAILFLSLVNLIANYYLVIKNFFFLWLFGSIIVLQVILIALIHPTILAVVRILIITQASLCALLLGYYLWNKRRQIKIYLGR